MSTLLELCLRWGIIDNDLYRKNSEITFLLKNHPHQKKVLVLGDSFSVDSMNAKQQKTAVSLLREYLEKNNHTLLNLAGTGYGPKQYLEQLKMFGSDYSPDFIILNYYVGNDLTDTLYLPSTNLFKDILTEFGTRSFLFTHLRSIRARSISNARLDKIQRIESVLNPFLLETAQQHPDYIAQNLLINTLEAKNAWEKNKKYIDQILTISNSLHATVLLNIFPSTAQVNNNHFQFYSKLGFQIDPSFLVQNKPQELLLNYCVEKKIHCFDLLPLFRKEAEGHAWLYLSNDDHWNSQGNKLAGLFLTHTLSTFLDK